MRWAHNSKKGPNNGDNTDQGGARCLRHRSMFCRAGSRRGRQDARNRWRQRQRIGSVHDSDLDTADTGGMQPRLALTYDHRSTNTLLGIGWNISGLSEITRCSRTWAQDLEARNVRNDSQDRFCLDGRKLRLFAGTYGAHGAEYRTEIETFSRVKSFDAAPTVGPGYFVVERNDGLKYEYGGTPDSRIESVGQNVARAWALNKISDKYGNAALFTYLEDTTNGAYRISSIQYTSNPDRSLSPAHSVTFTYEGKPPGEIDIGYVANSQIRELNRLTRIEVLAGTTLLRRYQLTYEITLSNTGRSRLKSLQECAGPSGSLDCLPETSFAYQAGGDGLGPQTITAASVPSDPNPLAIDVNGDGRDDLVYPSGANCTGNWMVMLATTSGGFGSANSTGVPATNCGGAIPIDYDSDGKADLLVPFNGTTWWYILGGASGLTGPFDTGIPASLSGAGPNAAAVDINGDGREDLVWVDLSAIAIRYRTREASGTFSSTVGDLWGPMGAGSGWAFNGFLVQPFGQYSRRRLPDFNGDGKGDLAFANSFSWWDPESQQTIVESFWDFRFTGGGGAQEPSGPIDAVPTLPRRERRRQGRSSLRRRQLVTGSIRHRHRVHGRGLHRFHVRLHSQPTRRARFGRRWPGRFHGAAQFRDVAPVSIDRRRRNEQQHRHSSELRLGGCDRR